MTLPRKGSRITTVDGRRYRWVITRRGEPVQGLVVEFADEPVGRLVASTNPFAVITPTLVAGAVRAARQAGWDPAGGGQFRLAEPLWGDPLLTP
jgi:hypothetical protein